MVSLKVDNLSFRMTPDEIKPIFEKYGEVGDIYIPRDPYTKESRGFAFVRFYEKRDAEDAMERLDGYVIDGREMRVQLARYGRPNENKGRHYGGGGGRKNRYRSRSRSYSRSRSPSPRRRRRTPSRSRSRSRSPKHDRSRSGSRTPPREYSKSPRQRSASPQRDYEGEQS
ncbi:PREDICTED: serine/arginine-rich splicing factor 2-like [Amphimedon queenslandica]|uniref:Serine/arginine-rich splicing factor 2 n=1 Tax=Amphimedon queenslandica TaxID=400682 RepID=I1G5E4_AMPQE|nr:PREDICTED: serine/arginine-rich splicing factor 2-like [Amphimedon queenslandica]|eukprot:XP_003384814.1 PREDICTED: serine/arginine-rich splicing factor 2-like [Amphimedon queenslandica]